MNSGEVGKGGSEEDQGNLMISCETTGQKAYSGSKDSMELR